MVFWHFHEARVIGLCPECSSWPGRRWTASCRLRIRRRRGPRGPPRGPARWDCEVRIVRHHL